MVLSNDERGWIMTSLSGVACVVGASVICVDIIIRQFPGKRNFKIQDSDSFLSASLSLSFGVMLFSSLYSMLPSSKSSLIKSGFDPKSATWIMIACFLGGFVGIQVLSRFIHQHMPSHVVDCEHSHEDEDNAPKERHHEHDNADRPASEPTTSTRPRNKRPRTRTKSSLPGHIPQAALPSPRRRQTSYFSGSPGGDFAPTVESETRMTTDAIHESIKPPETLQRPTFQQRLTARLSKLTSGTPDHCDPNCRGYTDVCGTECFKRVSARGGSRAPLTNSLRSTLKHNHTTPMLNTETTPLLRDIEEGPRETSIEHPHHGNGDIHEDHHTADHDHDEHGHDAQSGHHHHHVPQNAFLSIGLQTSIAIALHKLPEGFITYATNHANPQLGFSVFLALFIHNITEGFAMALPLYLAINSRVKAMLWSFVLGGLSQPIGAGVAALWFKIAGNGDWAPSEGVYGGMFAVTAGIMVSVALQLFSESLDLTHSRTLCMVGAITGMCILGISNALTAS